MKKIVLGILMVFFLGCTKDDKPNETNTTNVPSIKIGVQTWTDKNLDVATYSDGTVIPEVTDSAQWGNLTTGAWCYYNNDPTNGVIYGKLYNWYAVAGIWNEASKTNANQRKKLAPTGYHIPSETECATLITYLGGGYVAGGKMKETGTAHWNSPNVDATNSSGFTAISGGLRAWWGRFDLIGSEGYWWSSTEYSSSPTDYGTTTAMAFVLGSLNGGAGFDIEQRSTGYSVRCIKN
jgi:uncharacterized protein (TIGR02145 family)